MNRKNLFLWSIVICILGFADRITKFFALRMLAPIEINPFISLDFMLNRGISWGMFHESGDTVFNVVSCVVIIITAILAGIAYYRYNQGKLILGELLVLCGAISNLVDRAVYSGVIDFVVVHYNEWSFPVFNVADVYIVVGISIMFVMYARE